MIDGKAKHSPTNEWDTNAVWVDAATSDSFTFPSRIPKMFFAFVATAALSPQPQPSRAGRREVLFAVAAGSLAAPSALLSAPRQARASYAMYQGAPPQ